MTTKRIEVAMEYEGQLAADMLARGWEPKLYQIIGPRGGITMAWRSIATGQYSKV